MNNLLKILLFALIISTLVSTDLNAQFLDFKGMAAGWLTSGYSDQMAMQVGGRYIPQIEGIIPLKNNLTIEGEFSANFVGSYTSPIEGDKFYGKIKPYRMWMKISGNQFEIRAGLQKMNFGSATILRPLMWFDRIDPRDPLQLTDGVYGVLGRYYLLNNINFWAWGLYGNKDTKGWEVYVTDKHSVEFGGRFQFPVPRAEIGLTYHFRKATLPSNVSGFADNIIFPENRLGVDIKADLGIGIWMEDVVKYQDHGWNYPYTNMLTIGADYTFGLGNGLNIMSEHFIYQLSEDLYGDDMTVNFTGLSASYPLSLTANISAILYYDWDSEELYRFLNLGLTYDRFSYYLMGFWNPERFRIFDFNTGPSLFNGTGFQIMVVYNH
ncbi:MAG TPA: hypothetical protein VMW76_08530 [Bacteroidales bacterium]|nr:hypothetical protein [Bacteroidales bacterium]